METYRIDRMHVLELMRKKHIILFRSNDVKKMFPVTNDVTVKHVLRRLKHDRIIERLARNRYVFLHAAETIPLRVVSSL